VGTIAASSLQILIHQGAATLKLVPNALPQGFSQRNLTKVRVRHAHTV